MIVQCFKSCSKALPPITGRTSTVSMRLRQCNAVNVHDCPSGALSDDSDGRRLTTQRSRSAIVKSENDSSIGSDVRSKYFSEWPESRRCDERLGKGTVSLVVLPCGGATSGTMSLVDIGVSFATFRLKVNFGLGAEAARNWSRDISVAFKN